MISLEVLEPFNFDLVVDDAAEILQSLERCSGVDDAAEMLQPLELCSVESAKVMQSAVQDWPTDTGKKAKRQCPSDTWNKAEVQRGRRKKRGRRPYQQHYGAGCVAEQKIGRSALVQELLPDDSPDHSNLAEQMSRCGAGGAAEKKQTLVWRNLP